MTLYLLKRFLAPLTFFIVLTLAACGPGFVQVPTLTVALTPVPTSTETPVPLAVSVNGVGVTAAEFDAELARYQQAQASLGNAWFSDAGMTLQARSNATNPPAMQVSSALYSAIPL